MVQLYRLYRYDIGIYTTQTKTIKSSSKKKILGIPRQIKKNKIHKNDHHERINSQTWCHMYR